MNKYREQLNKCIQVVDSVRNMINVRRIPSNAISYNDLYSALYQLIPLIPEEYHTFRDRLRDKILPNLKTSDLISVNQFGQQLVTPQNGINPYSFGEVIATITPNTANMQVTLITNAFFSHRRFTRAMTSISSS